MATLQRSSASAPRRPAGTAAGRGFTLIELLTVMGVMIIITSIVVANAFGISKGAAYTSAREIPFNVLQYAHQRACMDGKVTAACFFEEGDEMCVSLFQVAGLVSGSSAGKVTDIYSDLAEMGVTESGKLDESEGRRLGGGMMRVFNFRNGRGFVARLVRRNAGAAKITIKNGEATADGAANMYRHPVTEIMAETDSQRVPGSRWRFSPTDWVAGDRYGFEVSERVALPKDFTYAVNGGNKGDGGFWLFFNPDGTSDTATINVSDIKGSAVSFRINVSNGSVSLSDK